VLGPFQTASKYQWCPHLKPRLIFHNSLFQDIRLYLTGKNIHVSVQRSHFQWCNNTSSKRLSSGYAVPPATPPSQAPPSIPPSLLHYEIPGLLRTLLSAGRGTIFVGVKRRIPVQPNLRSCGSIICDTNAYWVSSSCVKALPQKISQIKNLLDKIYRYGVQVLSTMDLTNLTHPSQLSLTTSTVDHSQILKSLTYIKRFFPKAEPIIRICGDKIQPMVG
jgi:hypothetical protein